VQALDQERGQRLSHAHVFHGDQLQSPPQVLGDVGEVVSISYAARTALSTWLRRMSFCRTDTS
jgi:hypothetical protein